MLVMIMKSISYKIFWGHNNICNFSENSLLLSFDIKSIITTQTYDTKRRTYTRD